MVRSNKRATAVPRVAPSSDPIAQLKESASRGELVAVIGTGVSLSLTRGSIPALSWKGLVEDGFSYGVKKGKITAIQATGWKTQLGSIDLDDLLAAAEFIGRKLEAPTGDLYARWLAGAFEHVVPTNDEMELALQGLVSAGIPLCTLNYDSLLERVTRLPPISLHETAKVTGWMRGDERGILHLHGTWSTPESCILGVRDYESTLSDEVRAHFQRSLASFRRLLFIGCGDTFADPNFAALIKWLRTNLKSATLQHYALVREDEVEARHADPTWHGFVEPISYGTDHGHLATFIRNQLLDASNPKAQPRTRRSTAHTVEIEHERLIRDYRAFLLKDCGQMTIEGVRADMDTAQRRFDLERLFVPLNVSPTPPEFPKDDPKREEKFRRWLERSGPRAFGPVFAKRRRLALLALPGGGKTLLLKRLAVAYADPERREASTDALPDLELTPVLIRCREWREHIHRPILTLLRNLPDITGHPELTGVSDALLPLFRKGRVLLLVDGLDEIHDDALRTTFVEHLEKFLDEYKLTRLVVTSREAGFNLVAPVLSRFCERWRVAPLGEDAITELCDHWHRLMSGDSPEARREAEEVAEHLVRNHSLRRLAENPLLLTMLLVVKHGAGRLPPDRVSLYSRAVDVLLDTWNIKGHAPLNPKEAVPQLAYVAFEMMRAGKQTATERELLTLLDDARESVPQIRRYAKDTPYEFLKRVELRSSLLMEAGHQVEGSATVPFYQFRHLTFQEYLAGVAVTEGHYREYKKGDTILTPLAPYLSAEEWKEVIPMTSVLARKQAEPLIAALVRAGNQLRTALEGRLDFAGRQAWVSFPPRLPAPIARLTQCLVEEAEATPETLVTALQLIALFAQSCDSDDDWRALSRGLYGEELLHQAWLLYRRLDWPEETWLLDTCKRLAWWRNPQPYWSSAEGQTRIRSLLQSEIEEEIAQGLFVCAEVSNDMGDLTFRSDIMQEVKRHIFHANLAVASAACWAWSWENLNSEPPLPATAELLDHLLQMWIDPTHPLVRQSSDFALRAHLGTPRDAWTPKLTHEQMEAIRSVEDDPHSAHGAAAMIAFHARSIWSDKEIARRLNRMRPSAHPSERAGIAKMLKELSVKV